MITSYWAFLIQISRVQIQRICVAVFIYHTLHELSADLILSLKSWGKLHRITKLPTLTQWAMLSSEACWDIPKFSGSKLLLPVANMSVLALPRTPNLTISRLVSQPNSKFREKGWGLPYKWLMTPLATERQAEDQKWMPGSWFTCLLLICYPSAEITLAIFTFYGKHDNDHVCAGVLDFSSS